VVDQIRAIGRDPELIAETPGETWAQVEARSANWWRKRPGWLGEVAITFQPARDQDAR